MCKSVHNEIQLDPKAPDALRVYCPLLINFNIESLVESDELLASRKNNDTNMAVRLAHRIYGPPTQALLPIVILHGALGHKLNWRTTATKLAKECGRQVITLDARNHGDSPHTNEMSAQLMSSDLINFLNRNDIARCVLIGHSMGGRTAMLTALHFPKLIESLIVVDVSPVSSPDTGEIRHYIKAMKELDISKIKDKREADSHLTPCIPNNQIRQFLLSSLIKTNTGRYHWKNNLSVIKESLHLHTGFAHINNPYHGRTLFIGGGESNYIREEHMGEIFRLFPSSLVKHIQGAGHWVHFEKPQQFLDLVIQFLIDCK